MERCGRRGKVAWPIAQGGPDDFLFSCDRMRIFDLPKPWALMLVGEELAHAYLIATNHPSHANPPSCDGPAFGEYDDVREAAMRRVLCSEWGFVDAEYAKMLEWLKRTEGGLRA